MDKRCNISCIGPCVQIERNINNLNFSQHTFPLKKQRSICGLPASSGASCSSSSSRGNPLSSVTFTSRGAGSGSVTGTTAGEVSNLQVNSFPIRSIHAFVFSVKCIFCGLCFPCFRYTFAMQCIQRFGQQPACVAEMGSWRAGDACAVFLLPSH